MDRYELKEANSDKFWEVGVNGSDLIVRFGRTGTQGQMKTKTCTDAGAAAKEMTKLIKEKTGKGYRLAGTSPAPAVAPAQPAPPKPVEIPAPEPPPQSAVAAAPKSKPAPADTEGSGRLFDVRPLPTRMRPGPTIELASADADFAAWIRAKLAEVPPRQATAAQVKAWYGGIDDSAVEQVTWHKRFRSSEHAAFRVKLTQFTEALVRTHGAIVALQAADALAAPSTGRSYTDSAWSDARAVALRAALAHLPEADYEAALAWCLEECSADAQSWPRKARYAFILADDRASDHALKPLAVLQDAAEHGQNVAALRWAFPLYFDPSPSALAERREEQAYQHYFCYCDVEAATAAATLLAVARDSGESAVPGLVWLLRHGIESERTAIAEALLETRDSDALPELIPHQHEKWIRAALDRATEAYPAWMFQQCLMQISSGRAEPAIRARVLDAVSAHGTDTVTRWASDLPAKATNHLAGLIAARTVGLAPRETWPAVLQNPPWHQKQRKTSDDIVLALAPIATPFGYAPTGPKKTPYYWRTRHALTVESMASLPATIAKIEARPNKYDWAHIQPPAEPLPAKNASEAEALAWLSRRLTGLNRDKSDRIRLSEYEGLYSGLEHQPPALAMMLWELTDPLLNVGLQLDEAGPAMLERFGEAALPGLVKLIESDPIGALEFSSDADAAPIAPLAARALFRLKKARALAILWLRRHRRTALLRLVPLAVGTPGDERNAAEHALRWYAQDRKDGADEIAAVVQQYAKVELRVEAAVAQVMERDPLARVPAKVAKLPGWVSLGMLSRPVLREGGALPDEAMAAIAEMLSFSTPDDPYAGIAHLRAACTPASLGAFAWDLFSAWLVAGAPSKDGWAMRAVGWLGNDECARQLTRLIRKWPGEAAHARAVTGLDVLVDIGSDVALMNLNGVAEKLKFKGLQEKAREKIAALAEARDLTPEELADRLAPDLDLDERGGLDLEFGPRRFRAGFDELLKPQVRDETGARLKDLPKPNKTDDAEKSAAAVARWAALKKDARAVASLQLARLETMLATSRRIKPDVFWTFFAAHPLIRNLARRLIWGTYADIAPTTVPSSTFRVTEDLTFANAEDEAVTLDLSAEAPGLIGLVHPLQLQKGELAAWGALFGDYEIAQPFPQLGRDTHALTEAEKASLSIDRFNGIRVEAVRLRGMGARGWPLGSVEDGGGILWLERKVIFTDGNAGIAVLDFGPGLITGGSEYEDKIQILEKLSLREGSWGRGRKTRTFAELDAIAASELLRGPIQLAETGVW
jgi:predicted DNA-binding WGR domain protein